MHAIGYLVGAGSMTLGVEAAGLRLHAVLETPGYDKNAATFRLNRPEVPMGVLPLDPEDDYFKAMRGIDLIYGNPPCGGVSTMTGSQADSSTNHLMGNWMRMIVKAEPRMILMENGHQLLASRMSPILGGLTAVLEAAGYRWWTWDVWGHQVGLPQRRRRAFLCASWCHDLRTGTPSALDDLPDQKTTVLPAWNWLRDLAGVEPSPDPVTTASGTTVTQHWWNRPDLLVPMGRDAALHRDRLKTVQYFTERDVERLQAKAEAGDAEAVRLVTGMAQNKHYWPDCPASLDISMRVMRPTTVEADATMRTLISGFTNIHPTAPRLLTMREHARLMGYPDSWQFHALTPNLVAQGVGTPVAAWATNRLRAVVGV